ncbi:MAG: DUF177 domain-containing protein [Caldilineaceae bacterium]
MQYNVAQLLKEPVGSVRRYELQEMIDGLDNDLELLGPVVGTLQIMRTNSGVLVTATLSTALRVECSRCLEPIVMPLRFEIEESFRPLTEVETGRYLRPDEFQGEAEDYEDEALLIDEHHILDLAEVLRQNIWLSLPMYPSCNWAGEGECPNLIARRQMLDEMQQTEEGSTLAAESEEIDPRWSALLALRGQLNDKE